MNDDIDSNRYNARQRGTIPPERPSRLWGRKLDLFKALWGRGPRREPGAEPAGAWAPALGGRLLLVILLALLAIPVGAIVVAYITRPAPGSAQQAADSASAGLSDSATSEKKAKPAPGRPLLGNTQAPPPPLEHPASPPTLQTPPPTEIVPVPAHPVTPSTGPNSAVNTPPAPVVPSVVPKPPYAPAVYQARHDKVFGEGCAGQLTLDTSGLAFKCFDDPHASVQVALDDIESVDSNGVRLISGKKYHFSIAGMAKNAEEALFLDWLRRVR